MTCEYHSTLAPTGRAVHVGQHTQERIVRSFVELAEMQQRLAPTELVRLEGMRQLAALPTMLASEKKIYLKN
jgi:hypothetical protein